jgi:hypothetical protein
VLTTSSTPSIKLVLTVSRTHISSPTHERDSTLIKTCSMLLTLQHPKGQTRLLRCRLCWPCVHLPETFHHTAHVPLPCPSCLASSSFATSCSYSSRNSPSAVCSGSKYIGCQTRAYVYIACLLRARRHQHFLIQRTQPRRRQHR